MTPSHRATLDPCEQVFLIDSGREGLQLFLRRLPALAPESRGSVLYLHGATFPSALSVAFRFANGSWRDALCEAAFDVWTVDFLGFGGSDRYPEMEAAADAHGPLGVAEEAVAQVEAAARFILDYDRRARLSFITHSWGSMPAGLFAARHPALVERIVMFAPLSRREGPRNAARPTLPAWRLVTNEDQGKRFVEDVPVGERPVLSRDDFALWAQKYLDSDPEARGRAPQAVKVPTGPTVEILRAWHGELAWNPAAVQAPVAILRGEWDHLVTDADARWLFDRLTRSSERRDVKIGRGTHLMHLEAMRGALWRESIAFLAGNERRTSEASPEGDVGAQEHHDDFDVAKSPLALEELRDLIATRPFNDNGGDA